MSVVFEGRVTNLTVKCLNPLVQFNPNMPWTHERFTWYMPGPTFLSQDMPGPVLNLTKTFGYKTGACCPWHFNRDLHWLLMQKNLCLFVAEAVNGAFEQRHV